MFSKSGKSGTLGEGAGLPVAILQTGGKPMNKLLMIGALAFAATTVANSAMAAEFYVVRDATTKKCTVVDTKPTSTTTTIVDNGTYKTKTEAETGMKTTKVCSQ
jgi:N-methylhydantoinase A/oxoprolinase/acetone carboxylase beta subunit